MKTTDPTLQAAADVAVAFVIPETDDVSAFALAAYVSAAELEQLLTAVRDAIAAPVLALHRPCHAPGQGDRCQLGHAAIADLEPICVTCMMWPSSYELYPCPTARALGVAA